MEVDALEDFTRELFLEVNEQRANRSRAEWAKTAWGRLTNIWAVGFSFYCAYKVVMVCVDGRRRREEEGGEGLLRSDDL